MTKLVLTCTTSPPDTLTVHQAADRVGLTVRDGDLPEPAMVDLDADSVDRLIAFLKVWRAGQKP